MNIKNVLLTATVAWFVISVASASQKETIILEVKKTITSEVEKICKNGKCRLWHTYQEKKGACEYYFHKSYELNKNTPLITKKNDLNISITSAQDFQEGYEGKMSNYFPTECSLPKEFYPKKFYVLEEEKYTKANCNAYSSFAAQYVVSQQKK